MAAMCSVCGLKAKRFCPAMEKELCSICCATQRMTEIKCTEDCGHNTFGIKAIKAFRELDMDFANVVMSYLADYYSKPQRELGYEALANPIPMEDVDKVYYFCREKLYHEIQPDGRTIFEIWQDKKFAKLNHDQKLLLEYKRSLEPTVVELQKNLDNNFAEFIDLLEPERAPFRILDPDFVHYGYPRFTRMVTYLETYPNFVRFSRGGGLLLPGETARMFIEQLKERSEVAGLPPKEYLRQNYAQCSQWPDELFDRHRIETLTHMDNKLCTATYDIGNNFFRIIERLLSRDDMVEDKETGNRNQCRYFVWLQKGASADFEASEENLVQLMNVGNDAIPVIASISLFPDHLELDSYSNPKYAFARQKLETEFGSWLEFRQEEIQELAKEMIDQQNRESADRSQHQGKSKEARNQERAREDKNDNYENEIPNAIHQQMLKQSLDRYYQDFLNQKIPFLGNMRPRDAAKNPTMRPELAELMKNHMNSAEEMTKNKNQSPYNFDWVLDELNLSELK